MAFLLEQAHSKPIDMGLDRIRKVATELDLLKPAPYVITVAGTNGKGSTCRLLEVTLLKAGFRVGVYSSPHLIHYNERVRINGEVLPDADHVQAFAKINAKRPLHSLILSLVRCLHLSYSNKISSIL